MLNLLGQGKPEEALELIASCTPPPNITGRPIEIRQIEWSISVETTITAMVSAPPAGSS